MSNPLRETLEKVLSGRRPAGRLEGRSLALLLLADMRTELQAIRAALAPEPEVVVEPTPAPQPVHQPDLLTGTVKALRERVSACSDVSVLEYALATENSKPRPRSTLQACLTQRIEQLQN